ncbi:uncharacterized protein KY384_006279 [Bacidia gigantensis]|uniref:uncharacterized protein n=1 Tax=Bacidia gigantensis TaxID=2732470 RepID=UPI001D04D76B|nr:uncharacterized protein KY384_006279 [Bacidia gigantensis]KAG8528592.1 hypothetical protein KY384_006279 [Bacidia gigantensis]
MEHLPEEILIGVIDLLEHSIYPEHKVGLLGLRQTSKKFARLAAPAVFKAVPVWIGVKSLQRLHDLSHNERVAQHVQKLRFSTLQIQEPVPNHPDLDIPEEELCLDTTSQGSHLMRVANYEAKYAQYYKGQSVLYERKIASQILRQALNRLPRLCHIEVYLSCHIIGAKELRSDFGAITHEEYFWDSEATLPILLDALEDCSSSISSFSVYPENEEAPSDPDTDLAKPHPVSTGINALQGFPARLDWERLECLNLDSGAYSPTQDEDDHDKAISTTLDYIRKAPLISKLVLRGMFKDTGFPPWRQKLPHLRHLEISQVEFTDKKSVVRVFDNHRSTLETAVFATGLFGLYDEDHQFAHWAVIAQHLRELDLIALRVLKLTIGGYMDAVDFCPYVKRQTGVYPIAKNNLENKTQDNTDEDSLYVMSDSDMDHTEEYDSDWDSDEARSGLDSETDNTME